MKRPDYGKETNDYMRNNYQEVKKPEALNVSNAIEPHANTIPTETTAKTMKTINLNITVIG